MDTMYPGKVNSPATTLDGGINDSVTTITVVDASKLASAPNLAVIGTGEDAETILYTGISSNDLTGCTREFQGAAKAWDSGTSVARFFTAYDYDTLRTNLGTHDPATTGVHGVGGNHIAEAPSASHLVRSFSKGWTADRYLKGGGVDSDPTERTFANVLADLSGQAGATFSWNNQILHNVLGLRLTTEGSDTISAGAITITRTLMMVATESAASTDDLDTINGGATINLVVLRPQYDDRTIVVKHGIGNIVLRGKADIVLDDIEDGLLLVWDTTNSKWFDISANDATTASVALYVDAGSGSDSNPGTAASPKATIQGALDALPTMIAHGCSIYVRPGSYDQYLSFSRFSMLTSIAIIAVNDNDEDMYDNGLATSGASTTLTDTAQSWATDQFNAAYIWIYEGTGAGQVRTISDTTATVITVSAAWTTNPDGTSYYAIGGGVLMSGTSSRHVLVDGYKMVNVYGFRHTGATICSLHWNNFAKGNCYNNYIPSGLGSGDYGIMIQAFSDVRAYYNFVDISGDGTQYGIRMVQASCWARANTFVGDDSTGYGLSVERMGIAQMAGVAYKNTMKDCSVGMRVVEGSGAQNIAVQNYISCVTDYSVDASSWNT